MTMRMRFVLMAVTALIMRVTALQGKIACDGHLTVYSDGAQVLHDTTWHVINLSLANTATVMAVKCFNKWPNYPGAFYASFDNGMVTDTSWRCSASESDGWTEASFDDSAWAFALESTKGFSISPYSGVSPSAKIIWSGPESSSYCRRNLQPAPDTTFRGKIGCDDELTVFLDGTEVASDTVWDQVNDIRFPDRPSVIAAKCVNTGAAAGIVGSFDGDLVTDATWRCSAMESDGWADASFDDSVWASAVESTVAPSLSSYAGVSPSAKFIWTSTVEAGTVYCRLNLADDD